MKIIGLVVLVLLSNGLLISRASASVDLLKLSAEVRAFANSKDSVTVGNCAVVLPQLNSRLEGLSAKDFSRKSLAKSSKEIERNLWAARLDLRANLGRLAETAELDEACVSGHRQIFQSIRFLEEYVGLHTLKTGAWIDAQPSPVFQGSFPSVVMAPGMDSVKFQSGDVLVSYGMAYGSAAISHVSDDGGMFSHMALIYKNDAGELYTIEAHAEYGVKVAPIEKYLNDGKGRSALFRHDNAKLAALAAKRMYDIAYAADSSGNPIPYDFTMDLKDHSRLFCSEVVYYAFEMASREFGLPLTMPTFPTQIKMKNISILDIFGIKAGYTFAPSDIDVDPQFQLMAEWRDFPRARLMHHQQATLEQEFHYLNNLNYNYRSDLQSSFDAEALYTLRHSPIVDGLVDSMIPPDVSERQLDVVVQVYLVSGRINSTLVDLDTQREKASGVLMTNSDILSAIDADRKADLAAFKKDRAPGKAKSKIDLKATGPWHWLLSSDEEWK